MTGRLFFISSLIVITTGLAAIAFAQDSLFEYEDSQGKFYCRFLENSGWESGIITGDNVFRSFKAEILRLKRIYQKKKSARVQKQIRALQKRLKSSGRICGEEKANTPAPGPTSTPTSPAQITPPPVLPTPVATQTISVTNTPAPAVSFFNANGDMTSEGKAFLNIPETLQANIQQGQTLFSQYNCTRCHSERLNRAFDTYRENLRKQPMNFSEVSLPDSDLSHLTAYLNRFR